MHDIEETGSRDARRRWLVSAVACLLLFLLAASGFQVLVGLRSTPPERPQRTRTYLVDVFRVEARSLREMVTAFGTARCDREVVVAAQVAGEIVEIHPQLRVGYRVPQRQSESTKLDLVVIDEAAYQQKVIQAQRRLDEDQADLARLAQDGVNNQRLIKKAEEDLVEFRREYERVRELRAKGVATQSDLTKATLELARYQDQVIALKNASALLPLEREKLNRRQKTHTSDLALAQIDLQHVRVRPPFAGVLGEVHVEKGQFVRPGEPLLRLVDDSVVEVPVALTLGDYSRVRAIVETGKQMPVELAVNESDPPQWTGHVVRVAPEFDELTRTARAFVVVDNREQKAPLVPGTFVHVRIEGPVLKDALVIPRHAILRESTGEDGRVFVVSEPAAEGEKTAGTVSQQTVKIGRTLQTLALIKPGALVEGDLVVLTNLDVLNEKSLVRYLVEKGQPRVRVLQDELDAQVIPLLRSPAAVPAEIKDTAGSN